MLTDEQLNLWSDLADAATPGPWIMLYESPEGHWWDRQDGAIGGAVVRETQLIGEWTKWNEPKYKDFEAGKTDDVFVAPVYECIADSRLLVRSVSAITGESYGDAEVSLRLCDTAFIAAARAAVPQLIEEIRRLRHKLSALEKADTP